MMKLVQILLVSVLLAQPAVAEQQPVPEPIKQLEQQGIQLVKPFSAPGGVQGWLGKYQDVGITLYLMPDGKHVVSGYMYDAQGHNLSETLIHDEITVPAGREMWRRLQKMPLLLEGRDDVKRKIVVFGDPFCTYCKQLWQKLQPAIADGQIQLQTLLVGVITPESGRYAAAILASEDPAKAWHDYELSEGKVMPPFPEATSQPIWRQIRANQRLMEELGANVTPAIYYMSDDNVLQQVIGLPDDEQMAQLLGK